MKCLALCVLLALPCLLLARPMEEFQALLKNYALKHPNTGSDEPPCEVKYDPNDEIGPLNAIVDRSKLWTNRIIYYEIAEPTYTSTQIQKIRAGVADLQSRTCITVRESNTAPNRVVIRDCGGCSSYVGMIGGRQQMCLAAGCIRAHGTIIHEFLHALGFHHEHMRSDRDNFVFINFDNIRPGTEGNFRKLVEGREVDLLGTKYDYGSCMHYPAYGFAVDRNIPTIIPLDPTAEIGQRRGMSALDVERVQILYGCRRAADSVYHKHLAHLY